VTSRAAWIHGLGRRFGGGLRRDDHRRRFGDVNRRRRGDAGAPALGSRFSGRRPFSRRRGGCRSRLDQARQDATGRAHRRGRARYGRLRRRLGVARRAFYSGLLRFFAPGWSGLARRASLPSDFDDEGTGRTLHGGNDLYGLPVRPGGPARIATGHPAATSCCGPRGENASRVNDGGASANRNLTLSGSFAND